MAVLYTPHFAYFTDDNGYPLAGGLLYTYAAGTTTPKATYTTAAGDVEKTNPIVLDTYGRAIFFLDGAYKFVLKDSAGSMISNGTTDNVTAFTTIGEAADSFFQSFSGDGSTVSFTLSEDLGTDEKLLMVFVNDEAGDVGFDIQAPSAYTVNGTTLTFGTAPPTGTNSIQVWAPSRLAGAAAGSAAAASASASEANTYAELALSGPGFKYKYSTTTTASDPGAGYFRLNNANPNLATEMYISGTSDDSEDLSGIIPTWDDGTSSIKGRIKVTNRADKTAFYVVDIDAAITDNTGWYTIPFTFVDRQGSVSNDLPTTVTFTPTGDKGAAGAQGPTGTVSGASLATVATDDKVLFLDTSNSDALSYDTAQSIADFASGGLVLLGSYTASNATSVDIGSGLDLDAAIDGTYDEYVLTIISLVPDTDGAIPYLRTSTNAGSSFDAGASDYDWGVYGRGAGGTAINDDSAGATQISLIYDTTGTGQMGNASAESGSLNLHIFDPSNAAKYTLFKWEMAYIAEYGGIIAQGGGGSRLSAGDVDAVRFLMSSGNIASGTFHLYGVRKS